MLPQSLPKICPPKKVCFFLIKTSVNTLGKCTYIYEDIINNKEMKYLWFSFLLQRPIPYREYTFNIFHKVNYLSQIKFRAYYTHSQLVFNSKKKKKLFLFVNEAVHSSFEFLLPLLHPSLINEIYNKNSFHEISTHTEQDTLHEIPMSRKYWRARVSDHFWYVI